MGSRCIGRRRGLREGRWVGRSSIVFDPELLSLETILETCLSASPTGASSCHLPALLLATVVNSESQSHPSCSKCSATHCAVLPSLLTQHSPPLLGVQHVHNANASNAGAPRSQMCLCACDAPSKCCPNRFPGIQVADPTLPLPKVKDISRVVDCVHNLGLMAAQPS